MANIENRLINNETNNFDVSTTKNHIMTEYNLSQDDSLLNKVYAQYGRNAEGVNG